MADSVEVAASSAAVDSAWNDALAAELLTLPGSIARKWRMVDGFTYLIELRRGREYRASVIQRVESPEVEADTQVKAVYDELTRIRKR